MKRKLLSLLQLSAGIGLVLFLFYHMDNKDDLLQALKSIASHPWFIILALASFGICILACAWRWFLILKAHDIRISFAGTMKFYFIGQFFNAFMPGAVGGDLVKAIYIAREFPDRRTVSVTTIFIDRLVGILSLFLLVDAVIILRFRFFWQYPETRIMISIIAAASFAVVGGLILMFRRNMLQKPAIAAFLRRHGKISRILNQVYSAFQDCLTHSGLMTRTTAVSLINHVAMIFAAFFIGLGLDIRTAALPPALPAATHDISARTAADKTAPPALTPRIFLKEAENYLTVFPVIDGIAAIPLTPGGLGTRDYSTKVLMGLPEFGVPATRSVPLSLLLYLTTMFWSLAGGIVYALHVICGAPPVPLNDLKNSEFITDTGCKPDKTPPGQEPEND